MSLMSPQLKGAGGGTKQGKPHLPLLQTTSVDTHGYEILIFLINKTDVERYAA